MTTPDRRPGRLRGRAFAAPQRSRLLTAALLMLALSATAAPAAAGIRLLRDIDTQHKARLPPTCPLSPCALP
jgi:hypothetical protein